MSQVTFRDEDVRNLKGFLEFVRDKAEFKLDMAEAVQLTKYVTFLQQHIRKVNDHVLELISMEQQQPAAEPGAEK